MQAVILAAGMATRLRPLTDETPKCLLNLDDKPIIHYMIENLKNTQVTDIILVTGFQNQKIENYLKENFSELKLTFIHNKDFESTNNAYSLLLAKDAIRGDFILLDSDIVFHPGILSELKNFSGRPVLAVDRHACGEEEIKVTIDDKQRIQDISKQVSTELAWGESVGIELFDTESKNLLFAKLQKRIIDENRVNEFYEASFLEMIQDGLGFYAADCSQFPAMEIDFVEDFEKAKEMLKEIY